MSTQRRNDDLLERTLEAAVQDVETVTPEGKSVRGGLAGVTFRDVPTHVDDRGMVFEMFDPRWNWHLDPLVFAYAFTIRPGVVKGWGLHKLHEDRYFLMQGDIELVLYDVRPESMTCGQVQKIVLSDQRRRLINIPAFVWHADHNVGLRDAVVVNFPTIQYDHSKPDKYRLPLGTPLIPYSFGDARGW